VHLQTLSKKLLFLLFVVRLRSILCCTHGSSSPQNLTNKRLALEKMWGNSVIVPFLALGEFLNYRHLLLLHRAGRDLCMRLGALLACLLVCGQVEGDEEDKVGAQNGASSHRGEWLASARTDVRKRWVVGAGPVVPRCEVNEACIYVRPLKHRRKLRETYRDQEQIAQSEGG
jgi:hypothetical protein